MYRILLTVLLFFFFTCLLNGQFKTQSTFISPIRIAPSFSGGFGELRRNHFHTGLDYRTAGQIGLPVAAIGDGFVARVAVSATGYGHVLYLQHPDGHTSVYGHLSRFNPKIENYVKEQQYQKMQFAVDLDLPDNLFSFKKGEIIAWSGNSGSSGGPHLHFEIRETASEKPQNPLFFLPTIKDNSAPRINSLYLYSLSANNSDLHNYSKKRFETIRSKQNTTLKITQPIKVSSIVGIGIQTDDDMNGVGMKWGIYSVDLFLDKELVFSFKMDHLAFNQGRYINSHIDFEELVKNKRWIHKLFLQPGNRMDIYQTAVNRGLLILSESKVHDIKIVVADAHGNQNVLSFKVLAVKNFVPEFDLKVSKKFYWDRSNELENEGVSVKMSAGSLYEHLPFNYQKSPGNRSMVSAVHKIHHASVPVHQPYVLSVKTLPLAPNLQNKALVVQVEEGGKFSPVGGEYKDSWITANPRTFGDFAVVLDTIPPRIQAISIKDNKTLVDKQKIEFKITDNLSGINKFNGEIDGKWVLFEYDAKSAKIAFTVDKKHIELGKVHSLQLTVEDNRGNRTVYHARFYL